MRRTLGASVHTLALAQGVAAVPLQADGGAVRPVVGADGLFVPAERFVADVLGPDDLLALAGDVSEPAAPGTGDHVYDGSATGCR